MSMTYTWNVTAMKVTDQINEQGQVLQKQIHDQAITEADLPWAPAEESA